MSPGSRSAGNRGSNATLRQVAGAEKGHKKDGGKELRCFFHRDPLSGWLLGLIIAEDQGNIIHPSIAQRRGVHPHGSPVILEVAGCDPNIHAPYR